MVASTAIRRFSADPIPARAGVGLKPEHYSDIVESQPDVGWFEIHAENYMGAGGQPHHYLTAIRELYPLSVHGVGLSIGAEAPLDTGHLTALKAVCDRYQPGLVSEHLAWSTHEGVYLNDLLPVPYNRATLDRICSHIDQVQDTLQRRILLENPSTYVRFENSDMAEVDFLRAIAERTGCGLLFDINNVYVSATNHAFDAEAYIEAFPVEHVGEIHLGGHESDSGDDGEDLLIDAHANAVAEPVWALYVRAVKRCGPTPTLVEWDNDVPAWSQLLGEARRAESVLCRRTASHAIAS